jgi:glycine cleavage system H protein
MSHIPDSLKYTAEHEWVDLVGEKRVRVGITDFAQSALGDIVYVQLPKVGEQLVANKVFGEVESTKSVSEIYSPVSGKVVAVNEELNATPEVINSDAYGEGWIVEIEIVSDSELTEFLSADSYSKLTS